MERMWRKVNHSFGGGRTKNQGHNSDTTSSVGGFGDNPMVVGSSSATGRRLATSGQMPTPHLPSAGAQTSSSTTTTSTANAGAPGTANTAMDPSMGQFRKSLSQHVLQPRTASSERRRRRRRKARPRRSGVSCVGGGGDNMSSSGGFYTINESHETSRYHRTHRTARVMASSAPLGTVLMYPNKAAGHHDTMASNNTITTTTTAAAANAGGVGGGGVGGGTTTTRTPLTETSVGPGSGTVAVTSTSAPQAPDISLRQRAVAKLRMFNFHLNWDLQMTHCKPCGSGSGGNIITRRLCRNRRREDNELYRSNSFKFERFERKEYLEELADTLQKQIAICDDYSLPVDFVKKRPSSFDPCLAEALPTNPENWVAASPQQEFLTFAELQQQQQQQTEPLVPPPPAPLSTLPSRVNAQLVAANANNNNGDPNTVASVAHSTLPNQPVGLHASQTTQTLQQQQQQQQHQHQKKSHTQRSQTQQRLPHPSSASSSSAVVITATTNNNSTLNSAVAASAGAGGAVSAAGAPLPPPLPSGLTSTIHSHTSAIKQASVKLIEGYSDPKDTKRHKKVYHKKAKRRAQTKRPSSSSQTLQQTQTKTPTAAGNNPQTLTTPQSKEKDKRSNYSSDSSAPKSSDDEDDDNQSVKVPDLNSPDSISDDLVKPLPSTTNRSPRKLTTSQSEYGSKRNPSPYYYSDLLKAKDPTASGQQQLTDKEAKQKSRQSTVSEPPPPTNQLYAQPGQPYRKSTSLDVPPEHTEPEREEQEDEFDITEPTTTTNTVLPLADDSTKRYSFTEDGVHIIRCDSPSTTTSEESDCSECLKRREWHARALALVRKTCNVQPLIPAAADYGNICQEANEDLNCGNFAETTPSMPPHRLLGPAAVCACVAPSIGDDIDEYFRPRSIFYVHPHGVHECDDCAPDSKQLNHNSSRSILDSSSLAQSDNALDEVNSALEDDMSGRTRQIYETAFDCKIAKSDDDLDEVDRITNHSVLLQLNNGNNVAPTNTKAEGRSSSKSHKSRLDGKRLKNSKNQAIQDQASNSGGNNSGSGSPLTVGSAANRSTDQMLASNISGLSTDLNNVHIREPEVDQQNNPTTSSSQLPMRGYTPSPPSTAPLPMKFPGKHERFFMNSIRSAPNLPSSNPAHPRLRDLRLPLQSNLGRQQQQQATVSSLATSNENSLNDSAYVNPPSSIVHQQQHQQHNNSHSHHHHLSSALHQGGPNSLNAGSSRSRSRPRSFVLESGRVLELRKSHASSSAHHHHHHHHAGNGSRRTHNYSSTESIATSSSGGSMESLRSSTSEGNRSTSSSESRHSTSLSSHSSESGSSSVAFPLRAPVVIHSKLHILSPISDKSSQEPASELSEQNKTQNVTPEDNAGATLTQQQQQQQQQAQQQQQQLQDRENMRPTPQLQIDALKKRRPPANKTLMQLTDEILGSDSGISLHSREDGKPLMGLQKFTLPTLNFPPNDKGGNNHSDISAVGGMSSSVGLPQDLRDLPFDMPKLRRRKTLQQDACTSGSATSVDLGDLPFDMPKLRRRLRANQAEINNLMMHSTESSGISQASSSHSMRDDNKTGLKLDSAIFRQNLTLNLNEPRQSNNKFGSLDLRGLSNNKELNLNLNQGFANAVDLIDVSIPLERQGWYHGAITRIEAETTLRPLAEGSFLVRNCESTKQDYSLSLKGAKGFMHMRIQRNECGQYILGQFSRPFETVPDMIRHFCLNRLPVRGAEHMCLIEPVIAQLL